MKLERNTVFIVSDRLAASHTRTCAPSRSSGGMEVSDFLTLSQFEFKNAEIVLGKKAIEVPTTNPT